MSAKEMPADPKKSKVPEDYEISSAADTLMRAEEIKNDPRLMPHVHKHLQKKKKAISSLADLKNRKAELDKAEDEAGAD